MRRLAFYIADLVLAGNSTSMIKNVSWLIVTLVGL